MKKAKEWAEKKGFKFFEGSAKNGTGVNEAFETLFDLMYKTLQYNREKYLQ